MPSSLQETLRSFAKLREGEGLRQDRQSVLHLCRWQPFIPPNLSISATKEPRLPNSPVYRLRIEPRLKRLIDARRGNEPLSTWLRRAASQRVESERGLGAEHIERLAENSAQLRGLGINLNQLAHAANEGRPVAVNRQLLVNIQGLLQETRTLLTEIKERLPE